LAGHVPTSGSDSVVFVWAEKVVADLQTAAAAAGHVSVVEVVGLVLALAAVKW
jgi:hypothetical protein